MKYFVTGATGFIGGSVARRLAAAGHQVVALARNHATASDLVAAGISVLPGDVTDKESMRVPMHGVDGVFHVAGWYKIGAKDKREAERVNVQGTRNVLELMRELGIPKGVYTSTIAIFSDTHGRVVDESYRYDGPHLSEYDRTKWIAHYEVAEPMIKAGLPLVIVQPGLVYGPSDTSSLRSTWIQYLQRRLPMLPQRTTFCWGHVDDTAGGHIDAMEKGRAGESYIIAGPRHTLIEAMQMAAQITAVPAPRLQMPPGAMKLAAAVMGTLEKIAPLPEAYTGEGLRIIAGTTYLGDNAKARLELGFDPRPLRDGLRETLLHEMALLGMEVR